MGKEPRLKCRVRRAALPAAHRPRGGGDGEIDRSQRVLARIGLGKLSQLEPEEPIRRYEKRRPGELIHIDVKKLGRIGPMEQASVSSGFTPLILPSDSP